MGIVVKKTTKDKKNLLGRRVVESKTVGSSSYPSTTKREVYNKKGEMIKSKSVTRSKDGVTKSKTNAAGTTRSVNKSMAKPTMLEKRVNKALGKK